MKNEPQKKYVLIIGMAGGLARITAMLLIRKYPNIKIMGVDSRKNLSALNSKNIKYVKMKYSRTNFESLFRENDFGTVLHLGRTSHASSNPLGSLAKRLDINVIGTKLILDLCRKYEVKKVVILSTFHVYGAYSDNPAFLKEEAPLRADFQYPELRDVVEMDQLSTNWMWKNRSITKVIVLRPCNIIGPSINNAIKKYLVGKYVPVPMDFNPMFQFTHEYDVAELLLLASEELDIGIYNIAPDDFISIRDAKKRINRPGISVPIFLVEPFAKMVRKTFQMIPDYLMNYIKFSCLIDNSDLTKALPDFRFKFSSKESLDFLLGD